jgi:thiol-disulfide isomerase/thioredoxin
MWAGPCNALLPEIGEWQQEHERVLTVAVVSRREAEANRPKAKEHGLVNVLLQVADETAQSFEVTATPGAVLVGADGAVESGVALGSESIRMLVAATVSRPPSIGETAPDFALPDLDGREHSLGEFHDRELLLLFWNPGCSFCASMTDALTRLDAIAGSAGIPELAVLTTTEGTPELRATVLVDPGGEVAARLGASGTPMAVRIDRAGTIVSEVAAGAEQVLALAEPALSPALAPAR